MSNMTLERAKEINGGCVKSATSIILGPEYVPLPEDVSLEDMLVATRIVQEHCRERNENGTYTMHMTVDPRGIALHYAFEHYGSDPRQMLEALGFVLQEPTNA